MQFESFEREAPTINISALIDVVFILLIFVVLAANFDRHREMNVLVPTAEETTASTADALVLTIPLEGPMVLDGEPVEEEALVDQLRKKRVKYDVLVLVGDGDIPLQKTVSIFDKASVSGFESVSIATQEPTQ